MRIEITAEAKAEYVRCNGAHCPRCKSRDIRSESVYGESGLDLRHVECLACQAEWTEMFKLVHVYGTEED